MECYLRTLLLGAPTSGGTWDSLLHAEVVESSAQRLPRGSKSTSESVRRLLLAKAAVELTVSQNETGKGKKE